MDLFLNELSISQQSSVDSFYPTFHLFVKLFSKLQQFGFMSIRIKRDFFSSNITKDISFGQLLYDQNIDKDERTLFLCSATKSPFIEELIENYPIETTNLPDFKYKNVTCFGLGTAFLYNSIAISFNTSNEWNNHSLPIEIHNLYDDESFEINNEIVNHVSDLYHIALHSIWIRTRRFHSLNSIATFWDRRQNLFPNLIFCDCVLKQVECYKVNDPSFFQIMLKLQNLENYCSQWTLGGFDINKISGKISPESETREVQFKNQLSILCPDSQIRFFTLHSRFTPNAGRIYFYPNEISHKIYIGYIGQKLL